MEDTLRASLTSQLTWSRLKSNIGLSPGVRIRFIGMHASQAEQGRVGRWGAGLSVVWGLAIVRRHDLHAVSAQQTRRMHEQITDGQTDSALRQYFTSAQ